MECQTSDGNLAESKPIGIVLNGEPRTVPAGLDIVGLLAHLELDSARVAIEVNREIVRQPEWNTHTIAGGSEIEIVQFVGGG